MSAPRRGAGSDTRASRGPRPSGPRTKAGAANRGPRPDRGRPNADRSAPTERGPRSEHASDRRPAGRGARPEAPPTEAETAAARKKGGGLRRTRQKARLTKKSGDVRSKPDAREDGAPKRPHASGPPTGAGIRYLRGLGHHLAPIVQIGKDGMTDALVVATSRALNDHELIKVKVGSEAPIDRKEAGPDLATKTGATLVQTLGRTLLLYKRHPSKPQIELPR